MPLMQREPNTTGVLQKEDKSLQGPKQYDFNKTYSLFNSFFNATHVT